MLVDGCCFFVVGASQNSHCKESSCAQRGSAPKCTRLFNHICKSKLGLQSTISFTKRCLCAMSEGVTDLQNDPVTSVRKQNSGKEVFGFVRIFVRLGAGFFCDQHKLFHDFGSHPLKCVRGTRPWCQALAFRSDSHLIKANRFKKLAGDSIAIRAEAATTSRSGDCRVICRLINRKGVKTKSLCRTKTLCYKKQHKASIGSPLSRTKTQFVAED